MSRFSLLMLAVAVTAGAAVGCAQCDTCDDFPAPCTGPNCGYHGGAAPAYAAGPDGVAPTSMEAAPPSLAPADDSAGPAPKVPGPTQRPAAPIESKPSTGP